MSTSPLSPMNYLLQCNSSTRIPSRDMFMLFALWMEKFPINPPPTFQHRNGNARKTGCVLVDSNDRVVSLDCTGDSHAIVRCILNSPTDPRGFDVFVSRVPCALCMRIMVQAGIRKVYYFPAKDWEIQWDHIEPESGLSMQEQLQMAREKEEKNRKSILRLIQNNPIAYTLYVPQWLHADLPVSIETELMSKYTVPQEWGWELDPGLAKSPSVSDRWSIIQSRFKNTILALFILEQKYKGDIQRIRKGASQGFESSTQIHRHAMVLAQIAAKRTDDPKIGVGSVLISETQRYISVGWNGYPKKSQNLDYPHAGADDTVDPDELKYDYILHAEQNALLWRNPIGVPLKEGSVLVSTKMPCDECSPVMADMGIRSVITIPQAPKSQNDPSRLRGLTYEKLSKLIHDISIFQ